MTYTQVALNGYMKKMRLRKGMGQQGLSNLLGYKNGQLVSNYERNLCNIPQWALPRLIVLLDCDMKDIIHMATVDLEAFLSKQEDITKVLREQGVGVE